jgi:hypothetical protein
LVGDAEYTTTKGFIDVLLQDQHGNSWIQIRILEKVNKSPLIKCWIYRATHLAVFPITHKNFKIHRVISMPPCPKKQNFYIKNRWIRYQLVDEPSAYAE